MRHPHLSYSARITTRNYLTPSGFVGANDGGSSTGLLLELARVLGQHPSVARKVELVFFDGEEAYENFSETDGLYGSRYFARATPKRGRKTISRRNLVRHGW